MATIKQFEDLEAWQKARALAKDVYTVSAKGDFAQDFGLRNQIRRAAGSVMDNIAEGFDRGGRGEFLQFLGSVKGSAGEVRSQLYRAFDQRYITASEFEALTNQVEELSRLIKGLQQYLNATTVRGERYKSA